MQPSPKFTSELNAWIQATSAGLLVLEADPGDLQLRAALIRDARRARGVARRAGAKQVEYLCHTLEAQLSAARRGLPLLTQDDFMALFRTLGRIGEASRLLKVQGDATESMLRRAVSRGTEVNGPAVRSSGGRGHRETR